MAPRRFSASQPGCINASARQLMGLLPFCGAASINASANGPRSSSMCLTSKALAFALRPPDLFPNIQSDLFSNAETDLKTPERMMAKVSPKLAALLDEACGAARMPWSAPVAEVNALLFHNKANWLPAEERECLRAAFCAESGQVEVSRLCHRPHSFQCSFTCGCPRSAIMPTRVRHSTGACPCSAVWCIL